MVSYRITPHFKIACILFLLLALIGCSTNEPTAPTAVTPFTDTLDIQLSWFHNVEFVGFYEAIQQGYYAEKNLEVNLVDGGINDTGYIDPVQRVLSGDAEFGVIGSDQILKARAEGHPLVAVAAIYQRSPVVLISAGDKGIIGPRDLVGKRVGVQPTGSATDIVYRAMLDLLQINGAQIQETSDVNFGSTDAIFNGEVDAMQAFLTNQGAQAQLVSNDVNLIWVSDYVNIYSNVIFTTEDMIRNHPDAVRAFVQATVQGIDWAVQNPDQAAQHTITQYAKGSDSAAVQRGMHLSVHLLNPPGKSPGQMEITSWNKAHEIMLDQGILSAPLDDVAAAFTTQFLEEAIAQK